MKSKQLISRDIEIFYERASEETRLDKGMGIFEFERIKSLIEKYISSPSITIIDVGGGTGKYSEWLSLKGHRVHLIEPVQKHVDQAIQRANKLKNKYTVQQGESKKMPFPDNHADLVILHGPLYHLQKKADRAKTIAEARRVVKTNGIILGFAINYTASTLVGLLNGLIHKKSFFEMCKEELTTGRHNPADGFPWLLAEAFYHRPEQLKQEFIEQELTCLNIYAVEGMTWLDSNFFAHMADDKKRDTLIELLHLTENDGYLLPFSPHMMIAVDGI
ncbi:class I SAM-dependent methyltransferase [Sphingobacterium pedocola]|uniref:SAM-dependent methyltransferase n=1 Tax=Sphingobacterium pedocola TaxID=2082722 RepID=A0ABR9T2Q6_9SPHI|nr:class I SAM-dependent methyltransferase [Sphingobacterium pedocola]MBE8719636.1 SAM-dependent methyltransferase [Sphingobacterium pedocola]